MLGLLGGLFVGQFTPVFPLWLLVVGLLLAAGAFRSGRWYACVVAVLAGSLFGLVRGSNYAQELAQLAQFAGREVVLTATLSQDPIQQSDSSLWNTQLTQVQIDGRYYAGEVYATIVSEISLSRGDIVTVQSKASEGFGSFQLSLYRAKVLKTQHSEDWFLAIRDSFVASVRRVMPEPEASLAVGFLVGQKSALPVDFEEQLKIVGLTHLVVASGYNLTILVRFARRVLARRSRYLALLGSSGLIAGFIAISGMSPSMNRAGIVTMLSLLAWYYGRKFHPIQLIVLVAACSAFFYPVYLWSDLGWLLSFAAFTGVLVAAPLLIRLCWKDGNPGAFARLVVETVSAELMTLPLIIIAFGYIPLYALLANILVAPVIPFAMVATAVAGLAGYVGGIAAIAALPASIVTAFVVAVVEKLAALPFAELPFTASTLLGVAWFAAVTAVLWMIWVRRRVDLATTSVTE